MNSEKGNYSVDILVEIFLFLYFHSTDIDSIEENHIFTSHLDPKP